MPPILEIKKSLGGVEDLLIDANAPQTVNQLRAGKVVKVTKINMDTIPAKGVFGLKGFQSLASYIEEKTDKRTSVGASNDNGGLFLSAGKSDLEWDGGTPDENTIVLAQKLPDGRYRWIGRSTIGSNNWEFRGRVSGLDGVNPQDYVTKSQLDAIPGNVQSDWDATTGDAFIKNKPNIPSSYSPSHGSLAQLKAGTDTKHREWTAKDLKVFSQTLSNHAKGRGLVGTIRNNAVGAGYVMHIYANVTFATMDHKVNFPVSAGTGIGKIWGFVRVVVKETGTYEFTADGVFANFRIYKNGKTLYSIGYNADKTKKFYYKSGDLLVSAVKEDDRTINDTPTLTIKKL